MYLISSKNEKTAMSRSIVAAIRKTNGRFLERSENLQSWYDIGDAKATEKTSQALREGQPKLRKKMINHGVINNDFHNSVSIEHVLSLLPTASATQIDHNPMFGDDSYFSVNRNDTRTIERQQQMLEQSLNRMFADIKPSMDDQHIQVIGNCRFHDIDCPGNTSECRFVKQQSRIVTPPSSPPVFQEHLIKRRQINNDAFRCPFPGEDCETNMDQDMADGDFDDSYSIMTFEMDEDEMIDDYNDNNQRSIYPIYPISTPSPPLTNHIRAINELKDNVPIYDKGDDQPMFSHIPATISSPLTNHLRALTELKDHVPIYPSVKSHRENVDYSHNNGQFKGNVSRNDLNTCSSSMRFAPSLVFPSQNRFLKQKTNLI